MTTHAPKCPKCGSRMVAERGFFICLNDSEVVESRLLKVKYITEVVGIRKTAEKWKMSSSTIHKHTRKDNGVDRRKRVPAIAATPEPNGHQLPAWSDTWDINVQLRYLDKPTGDQKRRAILEKLLCPGVKV